MNIVISFMFCIYSSPIPPFESLTLLFMDFTSLLLYYYKCVPAGVLYFSSPSNLENWELKADQSKIEARSPG